MPLDASPDLLKDLMVPLTYALEAVTIRRKTNMLQGFVLTCVAALALMCVTDSADATTTIKIGTLAPGDSSWGKEFKRWAKEVSNDTNGGVELDFQWNGQAGDEVLTVEKIRSGQLDGSGVSSLGLAQTGVTDVLIFNAPGLFPSP